MNNPSQLNLEALSQMMPGVFLWKKNLDSVYMELNHECAELFGTHKKRDISGLMDQDIPCRISEFSETFRLQDQRVIETGKPLKILEIHVCSKNRLNIMLNTKNPLRDDGNNIIGTFAYCIDMTKQAGRIQHLLSSIKNLQHSKNQLATGSYILPEHFDHQDQPFEWTSENSTPLDLTKREHTCLLYLVRGRTAQEIANVLFISKRTVEKHIDHIKRKLNCTSKSQLVDIAIEHGFIKL